MARKKNSQPADGLQMVMFAPEGDWKPPTSFPDLSKAKKIGLDVETRDERLTTLGPGGVRNDGYMVGFSLAVETGEKWYFPMRHVGGNNLDPNVCLRYAKDMLSNSNQEKVGVNLLYDLEWLRAEGVHVKGPLYDCSIAEALIDEEAASVGLDALLMKYCNIHKNEALLEEAGEAYGFYKGSGSKNQLKSNIWRLPPVYVGPYAEDDAYGPLLIQKEQQKLIEKEQLSQVLQLEMELIPLLLEMRFQGVPVDLNRAAELAEDWAGMESDLRYNLRKETGFSFDEGFEWSSKCLGSLCDDLKIAYSRSLKNGLPLIDKYFLEAHSKQYPILEKVAKLRGLNRLSGTYVKDLFFKFEHKGRIHAQFRPTMSEDGGTRSGRFSSKTPNLQQVPARNEELAPLIRGIFIPDKGYRWGKLDYSQQEPRITVHYAYLLKLEGAAKAKKLYTENPDADFYTDILVKATGYPRRQCKTIYLGRSYGMGKAKMAHDMGISELEAAQVFEGFDAKLPFIKGLTKAATNSALNKGYIKTFLGRRSHFNEWEPARSFDMRQEGIDVRPVSSRKEAENKWPGEKLKRAWAYKAMNRLIQGSAADMNKQAMLNLWKETKIIPYLTVHDEVDLPLIDEEQGAQCKAIMENSLKMECPIKCDLDVLDSWK